MSDSGLPALQRIYEAYHGKVLAYAAKLIGREEAEDLAQEVFLKVGRSLPDLKDQAKLTPWIYSITLNAVRDVARRRSTAIARLTAAAGVPRSEDPGDEGSGDLKAGGGTSPEEDLMRSQMVACYLDYVDALSPNYYDVYVLSELEDLPDQEIARRLSLSPGTVKIRLHRARKQLYEKLKRDCQCFCSESGELMGRPKDGVATPRGAMKNDPKVSVPGPAPRTEPVPMTLKSPPPPRRRRKTKQV